MENLIIDYLCQAIPKLRAIYLFGSTGTEFEKPSSDVDIAIYPQQPLPVTEHWHHAQQLALQLKKDVDLIDLIEASTVFRFEIINHSTRIYCLDETACDFFETTVYSMYQRLNQERKEILLDIKKRGKIS